MYKKKTKRSIQIGFEIFLKAANTVGNSDAWRDVIPKTWTTYTERPITNQSVGPRDDKTSSV